MEKIVRIDIHLSCIIAVRCIITKFCIFSGNKYDHDAAVEVAVSLNLCFSKPPIMSPRDSVSLNSLDFESQVSRQL